MKKALLFTLLSIFFSQIVESQDCAITAVNATPLSCNGNYFLVSVNLDIENPSSAGFTLAGNGIIYGTYLYSDLPVTVGPLLGDDSSLYEFIAWDVENPNCQNFTTLPAANCGPICGFSNATLELVTCISQTTALVDFDFDHVNTTNPAFDLFYENGTPVGNGTFLYASLPITINAFQVNGAAPIVLTVCDNNNDDCCETFTFDAIDCNPNNCEIFSVNIDPECTGNNFLVHLDFQYDNPASDSFTVTGNTLEYGTFAYTDLPITLGPLNGGTNINWEFNITDVQNPNCNKTAVLGIYHCPPPCAIDSLGADAFLCNGDDFYMLQLGLEIEGEGSSGYSVFSESTYYGSHSYDDLPLIIESYAGSGNYVDQITVCDNAHPQCCATTTYEALLCAGCIIYNLTATPQPCNDDDQFYVQIDFDHQNNGDEFEITGNGTSYGFFNFDDLPVVVGPFDGDGSTFLEFVVTDADDELCFAATEIGSINCNEICELSNLTVETGDCSGDDTYVAHIDFDYQGVTGIGFDLTINGEFYDSYSYDELPLTIEEFPSNGTGHDLVTVCENDNPNCCASLLFVSPDCACTLYEATAETLGCTTDSTFGIALEFYSQNAPNHNVDIYLDGVYWGFYNAENLPVVVNNIPEGDGAVLVTICASDQNDCCTSLLVDRMNCEAPECHIFDLFAEHGDCNSDSTYLLDFSFEYMNFPNDSVSVTANGELIGNYIIQPDFNRIENFPVLSNDTVHLVVCSLSSPDCCDDYTYIAPDCSFFGQCHIWDLQAFVGDCQPDSSYLLHIEFNYDNLPGDFVHIQINDMDFGDHLVNNGSIFIEGIHSSGNTLVTVCATGDNDCCDAVDFQAPNCGAVECNIWDLQAIVGDCMSDSTYLVHVEFNYENLPGDSVVITANGNLIGTHHVHEGNFFLEHFPVYDTENTVITVCAAGNDDCCDSFEFATPDCEGGGVCNIYDLVADPGDCNSDSTFSLFLHYLFNNLQGDSIIVTANGNYVGTYLHNPDGITIPDFPNYQTEITHVLICVAGSDCCEDVNFETPGCGQGDECNVYDLVAHVGDCLTDSTFVLYLDFFYTNLPSDSVHITANEQDLGSYFVNGGSITIEHFPIYDAIETRLVMCAVGNNDCCDVVEFETPNCEGGGTCHIYDLVADPGDCQSDSSYVLFIHYWNNNQPGDSVIIFANEQYIGTFLDNPDGITIENFPRFPGELTQITVCAQGAQDCCDTYTFETPFCTDECIIYNIDVQPFGCTSDSTFAAVIHFEYQNISAGGFDVYAGDHFLGFFSFSQLPVQTNQFPSNETGNYVVTICESDNAECCATEEFTGPTCGENACHIYDLIWDVTECDSNGHFYFILSFQYDHVGDDGFNIHGNGNNYGNFSYDSLPLQLGPFENNGTNWEFVVNDDAHPDCFDIINPGVIDCTVATDPINPEEYFAIFNNGATPGILAKRNLTISLFNGNGKLLLHDQQITQSSYKEFNTLPDGFYLLMIQHEEHFWPVKLIKTGY